MLSGRAWLEDHLENFVKPYLGYIPSTEMPDKKFTDYHSPDFDSDKVNIRYVLITWTNSTIDCLIELWKQAKRKAGNRTILLAGRDVYLFEVLARIDDTPTVFKPEISTCVARKYPKRLKEKFANLFLIDTGYKGSVPIALGVKNWMLVTYRTPKNNEDKKAHDLTVGMKKNNALVGMSSRLESAYKYWESGVWSPRRVARQNLENKTWFALAAVTTQLVAERYLATMKRSYVKSLGRGI